MAVKVAKFGGSSLATAQQFERVAAIIRSDADRRYVVPSAPGKAPGLNEKVTDMLYACQREAAAGRAEQARAVFARIAARYTGIIEGLGLSYDLAPALNEVWANIANGADADYAASRGEYLNGLVLADLLGYDFVDPANCIVFTADGVFDEAATQEKASALLSAHSRAVVPGFYGARPDGSVKTFSRGGSDITGAIVARAVNADIYENWTDVSGFKMADPRIVNDPKTIPVVSYQELRELSYMGANVLHEDSIFPVRKSGIPIQVKNTNRPEDPGTMIVSEVNGPAAGITGIAGRKGMSIFHIEKDKMNNELGFGRRVLSVFEKYGVSFEHLPTGIDTMSVVVQTASLNGREETIMQEIQALCAPEVIEVSDKVALIATVGRGMIRQVGTCARLFTALGNAGINIRMIDQGSSEINIIVGIDESDFETAIRAIYGAFAQ
ncbi:MAG: aspartate kinase [Clostridia bacterium]|nr:aspartate kinase [Clostridia bacterium]